MQDASGKGRDDAAAAAEWAPAALVEWLETTLFPVYLRPLGRPGLRWCSRWWAHAEAWVRFAACHRAWEALAGEAGTGLSVWHRDHLDPMLRELLGDAGPFAGCTPLSHTDSTRARHVKLAAYAVEVIPREVPDDGQAAGSVEVEPGE